jgi:hypothetical protein
MIVPTFLRKYCSFHTLSNTLHSLFTFPRFFSPVFYGQLSAFIKNTTLTS